MPPKGKHKAAPKPTAASELASALGVAKFSRIKHGDLQHEANVKRSFTVPRPGNLGVHILQVAILLPPAPALVCVPGGRTGSGLCARTTMAAFSHGCNRFVGAFSLLRLAFAAFAAFGRSRSPAQRVILQGDKILLTKEISSVKTSAHF